MKKITNILLVEDEPAHVELMRRAFEAQSEAVHLTAARSLQEAQDYLAQVQPDLVIVDLCLPDGDGTELLPANQEEAAYPVVVLTSYGSEQVAVEAMKAGALDYVVKSEAAFMAMPRIAKRVLRVWNHIVERKQAEEALRKSEALLTHTQRIAHLGSWEFDLAADEVYWSDEIYRIFGLTPGEINPNLETAMGFIHPDDREAAINTVKSALAAGESYQIEKRIVRADGQERFIVAHGEPVFNGNREIVGLTGFIQDLTERKRAEEALRESEDRLRTLMEKIPDGVVVIVQNKIVYSNPAASGLLGYTAEEIQGSSPERFVHPEEQPQVISKIGELNAGGPEYPSEYRSIKKNGELFWVEVLSRRIQFSGQPGVMSIIRDLTERKQAEEEIYRRNRELALLNRIIAASAASLEPERILEVVCRELTQTFDLPQAAAALLTEEKTALEVVAEYRSADQPSLLHQSIPLRNNLLIEYLTAYKAPLAVTDAQNDPRLASIRHLLRQRGTVSILIFPFLIEGEIIGGLSLGATGPRSFSPAEINLVQSVADQVAGAVARTRLEAARRRLEAQYYQAQKVEAIGQLAAGIAHDFNNILTAINGFAELLQLSLAVDDPDQEVVAKILNAGQRAADLVRQLLAFSRKQIIELQVVNLNTIVVEVDKLLQRLLREDIELIIDLKPSLWPVKVDPAQMQQILVNLAVNACDAMPAGGQLIIKTTHIILNDKTAPHHLELEPGQYVLLIVSDTGHGMNEQTMARIFEPFFTTKELGKGTGLGLATVFGIVKQSGGHILVESQEGTGTTFKIYLPRSEESEPLPTRLKTEVKTSSGNETILLVDDDPKVRELARRVLQRHGYTLLEARNGQEALQLTTHHAGPIDLLLTDVIMPDISGQTLAEQMAEIRPNLKVLFMSGYTADIIESQGISDTGNAFLQKPFKPAGLTNTIRAVLDS